MAEMSYIERKCSLKISYQLGTDLADLSMAKEMSTVEGSVLEFCQALTSVKCDGFLITWALHLHKTASL